MENRTELTQPNEPIDRILQAAALVFADAGYGGARIDEIARQAKINKAMLYYYIGGKLTLYEEVIQRTIGETADRLTAAISILTRPEDKLSAYIHQLAVTLDEKPFMPRIMMRELAAGGSHLPQRARMEIAKVFAIVTEIVEEGVTMGTFLSFPPFLIHLMVMGTFISFKATLTLRNQGISFPQNLQDPDVNLCGEIEQQVRRLILNAITKRTGETT